jgi:hypothetical protein
MWRKAAGGTPSQAIDGRPQNSLVGAMIDRMELVQGNGNPFRDARMLDPDVELMEADLTAAIIRVLRERDPSGGDAAHPAEVTETDI